MLTDLASRSHNLALFWVFLASCTLGHQTLNPWTLNPKPKINDSLAWQDDEDDDEDADMDFDWRAKGFG